MAELDVEAKALETVFTWAFLVEDRFLLGITKTRGGQIFTRYSALL